MSFLMDWISQIIIFIFLATFISLLVPRSSHEKVIKLVLGLVLFLLFLHPLSTLFRVNPESLVDQIQIESLLNSNYLLDETVSEKKVEIQATADAYILEQLREQIENIVGEELISTYGVNIDKLSIETNGEHLAEQQEIESITFQLSQLDDGSIQPIEAITIPGDTDAEDRELLEKETSIKQAIASRLDLPLQSIHIEWEGG